MLEKPNNRRKKYTEFGYVNSDRNNATFIFNFFVQMILHMDKKFERISRKKVREMCKKDVKHQYLLLYLDFLLALRKIIKVLMTIQALVLYSYLSCRILFESP